MKKNIAQSNNSKPRTFKLLMTPLRKDADNGYLTHDSILIEHKILNDWFHVNLLHNMLYCDMCMHIFSQAQHRRRFEN